MNEDIFKGNWEIIKGKLKQAWGKLTDDDIQDIKGNQEEIFGKLQKHYGYSKEKAKEEVNRFLNRFD